jgi:cell division protein FtsN
VANQDYVRRGRNVRKPPRKATPKRRPWRAIFIAIAACSAFGYGLLELSSQSTPTVVDTPSPQVDTSVRVRSSSTPDEPSNGQSIPPPPQEKWDYVDMLPNNEVEVQAKDLAKSNIPYIMQCGAYKTSEQAEQRKLAIAFQGMNSKIVKKAESSWYRVILGPYVYKRDAEKDKHQLQRVKIEPCAIWTEPQ